MRPSNPMYRRSPRLRSAPACVALGAAAVLGVVLSGCSGAPSPAGSPTPLTSAAATSAPAGGNPTTAPTASSSGAGRGSAASSGTIFQTVAARPLRTRRPVALNQTAETSSEIRVRILAAHALRVTARGPGEVSGPGVSFTVQVINRSGAPVSLDLTSANLVGADGRPASQMGGPPAHELAGVLADGSTARGVYVFRASPAQRRNLWLTVSVDPALPTAAFRGRVS